MPALRCLFPVLLLLYSPALGATTPAADPAVYLQAFNDACRRGFPDLDMIARNATAHGWVERSMHRIDGVADTLSVRLPRALNKDGMMLFLVAPENGEFKAVCQITGTATTSLSGRDVAALVSPSLNTGEPTFGPGNPKEDDLALWTVAPGLTVQAGISVYRRKIRTISIAVRQAR